MQESCDREEFIALLNKHKFRNRILSEREIVQKQEELYQYCKDTFENKEFGIRVEERYHENIAYRHTAIIIPTSDWRYSHKSDLVVRHFALKIHFTGRHYTINHASYDDAFVKTGHDLEAFKPYLVDEIIKTIHIDRN